MRRRMPQYTHRCNPLSKGARVMVANENEKLSHKSIGSISNNRKNANRLPGGSVDRASVNALRLNDSDSESSLKTDSMYRATFNNLVEDVKSQLIVEMKYIIEENWKEMKDINEKNRKEMEDKNEENQKEMKSMFEVIGKEIKRLEENDKEPHKTVPNEYEGMEAVSKPRQCKVRARLGRAPKSARSGNSD